MNEPSMNEPSEASGENTSVEKHTTSYKTYWVAWGLLLTLTLAMLLVEATQFPRLLAVFFLLTAMLFKGGIIAAWFMHLRFERRTIVLPLVLGALLTAIVLFGLISIDGVDMLRQAE